MLAEIAGIVTGGGHYLRTENVGLRFVFAAVFRHPGLCADRSKLSARLTAKYRPAKDQTDRAELVAETALLRRLGGGVAEGDVADLVGHDAGAAAGRPIYWAGRLPDQIYELTQMKEGGFLVRYLPPGSELAVPRPHLTVGTYPVTNAIAAVRRLSRAKGAVSIKLAAGGLAVVNPRFPEERLLRLPRLEL